MTDISSFEKSYTALNAQQKLAVDAIEGPVMVIAGPGTGKTQILTLRIAHILQKTDAQPENILALTFTESGARAMRERLRAYIGARAYRVSIFTFHGFAEHLIRSYPEAYDRVIGARAAGDIEKIELIEEILASGQYKYIRPLGDPSYYLSPILRAIGTMKQEYITPDLFSEIIARQETDLSGMQKVHEKGAHKGKVRGDYQKKEKSVAKNKELLSVYRLYEQLLADKRLYDFEDMIVETVKALEGNEDLLRELQETYHYILADEHQDVNGSQNRILELLASYHSSPNLFVVGDEKQAIYRFQGASLENFLYFEDAFPETKTIALTSNYRSGQSVLDAAHSLIFVEDGPQRELRIPLISETNTKSSVAVRAFSHQAVEDEFAVSKISALVEDGISEEEIAIIVRTNREVEKYASLLRAAGIAARASADSDILTHPVTHAVTALMRAVSERGSESALFQVLHGSYWGISRDDLLRVLSARSYQESLLRLLENETRLHDIGVVDIVSVQRVLQVIAHAQEKETTEAPHRVLEYILSESGLNSAVMENDPLEGGRVLRRLYDEIESLVVRGDAVSLADVLRAFSLRSEHNLPLSAPYIATDQHAVQVMTAHKSKGLEFEHVFVPHLVDSVWGGKRRSELFDIPLTKHLQSSDFDSSDDERRLLYVAITRAKVGLYLSHAQANTEGKPLLPTRLFEYIDETLLQNVDVGEVESTFDPVASLMQMNGVVQIDPALIKQLFLERGLSATALNNYLKSPWNYFYRNMLRIPEVQPVHMLFGTALHNTMEKVTRFHTAQKKLPSDTEIKKYLERELGLLPITKEEFTTLHEKGFTALMAYIPHAASSFGVTTREEQKFRVLWQTGDTEVPEITLTGMIDRIDFDEGGEAVCVVDYKSGKPKTRGVIEGTTKDSNGEYKRQLVFYALLLSLYDDERLATNTFVLSFLEPDSKGVIHEEVFGVTKDEVEELKTDIIRVAKEIVSGDFLSAECDPAQSEYCDLMHSLVLCVKE